MSASSSRYRILSSLGKGGMGEVFLGEDAVLERKVAIKFLNSEQPEVRPWHDVRRWETGARRSLEGSV